MKITFRQITEQDYRFIKEVYDYYVLNSTATFHTELVEISELKKTILLNHSLYKSYLVYFDNEACGYCYLGQFKPRQAYDRTSEITVYIKPEFHSKGIGKTSLEFLCQRASELGLENLIGVITKENNTSVKLFEKLGFEKCAHYKRVGEKFNRLLDVVAYQKEI